MGLAYVDRYLINSHLGGKILETWDAMIELQQEGLIRWAGLHGGLGCGFTHMWVYIIGCVCVCTHVGMCIGCNVCAHM